MKPLWTAEKANFSWWTVVNDEGETVDASGDGGFYEETAKRVAECENIYFETSLTPIQLLKQRDELLEALINLFACDMEYFLMCDGKDEQIEAIQQAKDAIAKAKGSKQ